MQNFIHGVQLPTIFSEARKYGLALTIRKPGHVHVMTTCVRHRDLFPSPVFGNCATVISFRVGGNDVRYSNANSRPSYQRQPAFRRQGAENDKMRVIETSLRRYSRPRAEVDLKFQKFFS